MKGRIDSLQAVRAIACILIFMHHCYICGTGALGAAIFIMLSGFLMCRSYYDRSLPRTPIDCLRFSARKIWKLYPLHILTMLPVLALDIYTMKTAPQPSSRKSSLQACCSSNRGARALPPRSTAWHGICPCRCFYTLPFRSSCGQYGAIAAAGRPVPPLPRCSRLISRSALSRRRYARRFAAGTTRGS